MTKMFLFTIFKTVKEILGLRHLHLPVPLFLTAPSYLCPFCNVIQYYSILIGSLLHVIQIVRQTAWYNVGLYVVWIWGRWFAAGSIAAFSRVPSLIYRSSYCPCGVLLVSVWVSTRIFGFLQTPKNMPTDGLDTLNCPSVSISVCMCVRNNLRYTGIAPLHILLACAQCFQDNCETVTEDAY